MSALALLMLALAMASPLAAQDKHPARKSPPAENARDSAGTAAPSQPEAEAAALDKAFSAAPGDPQALIKNLEAFLEEYPHSARREQVLRTIYKQALQGNDPRKAAEAAEKLLATKPDDPELLGALTDLYDRQNDPASHAKALEYATRFIQHAEKLREDSRPSQIPAERWQEVRDLFRAAAYARRGKIYAQAGESEKAADDFESSLDAYATAFILPDKRLEPAQREQIRRKLGSAYALQNPSEQGLGDLILARYDELVRSHPERFAAGDKTNADVRDPFQFVLARLDGTPLKLAELRGKVLVMDFWATWCGPCRLEGKLLERVVEAFRAEKSVEFLAVNTDEEPSVVADFVKDAGWRVPVVYARGLDGALGIRALPTVLILDAKGRVVFRQVGIDPGSFISTLEAKVRQALEKSSD
jgi:thiol-disulfide isomerase/thioredoxin